MRPRAFSIVPVHSEQCRPAILARIRAFPSTGDGSADHNSAAPAVPARVFVLMAA